MSDLFGSGTSSHWTADSRLVSYPKCGAISSLDLVEALGQLFRFHQSITGNGIGTSHWPAKFSLRMIGPA